MDDIAILPTADNVLILLHADPSISMNLCYDSECAPQAILYVYADAGKGSEARRAQMGSINQVGEGRETADVVGPA